MTESLNQPKKKSKLLEIWGVIKATFIWILILEIGAQILIHIFPGLIHPEDERSKADSYGSASWVNEYYQELWKARSVRWQSYTYWRRQPYSSAYINIASSGIRATPGITTKGPIPLKNSRFSCLAVPQCGALVREMSR